MIHEMTHGITNRMTGGGTGRCLQTTESGGMGEGWSDAMAEYVSCLLSLPFSIPRLPFSLSPRRPFAIHIATPSALSSFPYTLSSLPPSSPMFPCPLLFLPPPNTLLTLPSLSHQLDVPNLCKHKRLHSRPIRLQPRPRPPLVPLFDFCNYQSTAVFKFAGTYGGA